MVAIRVDIFISIFDYYINNINLNVLFDLNVIEFETIAALTQTQ